MYGNVGLQTAKGSGTSGYVQKSLAYISYNKNQGTNYGEILQKFRANPVPIKRRANQEIIEHEKLHKIEAILFEYGETLKKENITESEIEEKITKKRKELLEKSDISKNPLISQEETHQQSKIKYEQLKKLHDALGVEGEYVPGSAFDFDAQYEQKVNEILEKKKKEKEHKHKHKHHKKKERSRSKNKSNNSENYKEKHHKKKNENNSEEKH